MSSRLAAHPYPRTPGWVPRLAPLRCECSLIARALAGGATPSPTLRFPCFHPTNARSRLHAGFFSPSPCLSVSPFPSPWRRRMGIEPTGRGVSPGPTALKAAQGTSPEAPPLVRIGYACGGVKMGPEPQSRDGGSGHWARPAGCGGDRPIENEGKSPSGDGSHLGGTFIAEFPSYFLLFASYSGHSISARATRFPPSPRALLRASFAAPMSLSELSPFPG